MPKTIIHRPDLSQPPPRKTIGLGDVTKTIISPIAIASDAILKTNLVGCSACNKRAQKMNDFIPNVLHPFKNNTKQIESTLSPIPSAYNEDGTISILDDKTLNVIKPQKVVMHSE
jgi:hypothetical protein